MTGTALEEGAGRGAQTLARGLRALTLVCEAPGGLTVTEVAVRLGVHRSIASRLLVTLHDFGLVARGSDARFRPGAALCGLADVVHRTLREVAAPLLRELAEETGANAGLMVREGDEVVGLAMAAPPRSTFQIVFGSGKRHPVHAGADGHVLLALEPPAADEPDYVTVARERGWAHSHGQVEPGAHGVAVALPPRPDYPPASIVLISLQRSVVEEAVPVLQEAVERLDKLLD